MLKEQRKDIFENMYNVLMTETYDGHQEPESLEEFRSTYKQLKKFGMNDNQAKNAAASQALISRGIERKQYHDDKSLEVLKKGGFDKADEEMKKGIKQQDRAFRHSSKAIERAKRK